MSKNIQLVALFFILVSIPVASVINQQVHNYQSAAHDREERERSTKKTSSIFGFVYEDANRNQIKDNGENGVAGVTVILKTRSKNQIKEDDDDDDRNERERKIKQSAQTWTEKELMTDTLGSFKLDVPRNISVKSLKYRITVKPPEGYVLMSTNTRYQKNTQKRKGERIILLGIARDVNTPQPTSPPVSITGAELPTEYPVTITPPISIVLSQTPIPESPTMSPPVVSSPPDLSPQPTSAPSTNPTLTVCPPPPICEGELVTVDQPNAALCPIYICYSIDPGQ